MRYLDFDLLVEQAEQGFEARVLHSPAGEAKNAFGPPFGPLELENMLLRLGRLNRASTRGGFDTDATRAAKALGSRLYEAAFGGDVRTCLGASLQQAETEGAGLRIRLRVDAPGLADVPWEYLYDTRQNRFLALSSMTSLVRYLELGRSPRVPTITRPLRIFVVISNPPELPKLNAEDEWLKLNAAVGALPPGTVELIRAAPQLPALQTQLRRGPVHVFHYIGHGDFVEDARDGLIFLEDEHRHSVPVSSEKLAILLHNQPSLRLAVLNCCEGARTEGTQPFSGVGPALVQQGLPAVVAMQFPIRDTAAVEFARSFYQCLAEGLSIDAALVQARLAMYLEEDESFGAPVLYMRSTDGMLFDLRPGRAGIPDPVPAGVVKAPEAVEAEPRVVQLPAGPQPAGTPLPAATPVQRTEPERQPSRFTRTGAVAFGLLWAFLSLTAFILAVAPDIKRAVAWDSVRNWARAGLVVGLLQGLLFLVVRTSRGLSGNANLASWSIAGGMIAAVAAVIAKGAFDVEPRDEAMQAYLFIALYGVLQYAMIRRHTVKAPAIAIAGAAAGTCLCVALQIASTRGAADREFAAATVLFFVASFLLTIQGAFLGRDPMVAVVPREASVRRRAFIGTLVVLLFLLTLIPG